VSSNDPQSKRRLATGAAERATLSWLTGSLYGGLSDKADHGASLLVDRQRYKFFRRFVMRLLVSTSLLLTGLYADKSGLGDREYMKTHFPNLKYVEIAGTGHFLMLEKPAAFNRLLLGFLYKQTY
jgi:pimeloyl-ACP methyl ester carboxylesterase